MIFTRIWKRLFGNTQSKRGEFQVSECVYSIEAQTWKCKCDHLALEIENLLLADEVEENLALIDSPDEMSHSLFQIRPIPPRYRKEPKPAPPVKSEYEKEQERKWDAYKVWYEKNHSPMPEWRFQESRSVNKRNTLSWDTRREQWISKRKRGKNITNKMMNELAKEGFIRNHRDIPSVMGVPLRTPTTPPEPEPVNLPGVWG